MSSQHKRPFMAFVVLVVLAAALIGNGIRANAEHGRFIAAGVISATTPLTHGTLPAPADEGSPVLPAAAGIVAAATPSREERRHASAGAGRQRSTGHRAASGTAGGTAHERDKNIPAATASPAAPTSARTHAPADHGRERAHRATGRVRAAVEHAVDAVVAAPEPSRGHGYGRVHAPGQLAGLGRDDHGRHLGHDKHAAKLVERLRGR